MSSPTRGVHLPRYPGLAEGLSRILHYNSNVRNRSMGESLEERECCEEDDLDIVGQPHDWWQKCMEENNKNVAGRA